MATIRMPVQPPGTQRDSLKLPGSSKGTHMIAEKWEHPLIHTTNRRFNRRRFLLAAGAVATLTAFPESRNALAANAQTPVVSSATGNDDAVSLLDNAAKAMAELKTFHFDVETTRGESSAMGLKLKKISGDVRRPSDFQTEVSVDIPFGSIDVRAVGLNGSYYIQDPLSKDGTWRTFGAGTDILALINPDVIILMAVRALSDAKIDGTEKYDGVEAQRVVGSVDFKTVAQKLGGDASGLNDQLAQGPVPVTIWIDPDKLILGIEIDGPLLAVEGDNVIRLVSFSAFNEPVTIEAPPV